MLFFFWTYGFVSYPLISLAWQCTPWEEAELSVVLGECNCRFQSIWCTGDFVHQRCVISTHLYHLVCGGQPIFVNHLQSGVLINVCWLKLARSLCKSFLQDLLGLLKIILFHLLTPTTLFAGRPCWALFQKELRDFWDFRQPWLLCKGHFRMQHRMSFWLMKMIVQFARFVTFWLIYNGNWFFCFGIRLTGDWSCRSQWPGQSVYLVLIFFIFHA